METVLNKAFCGVYNSSKEIIRNNQRHLYCNMLDLLARTTKTTGEKYLNLDEFILFWATDILPLIFDEDKDVQKSAIAAMESITSTFNFKTLHNSACWNDIKTKIVQNYSKEIYKYREASNSCWHRIWCILIRILDREIIKGASTINTFLSIVELGFRSPDYNVRAEAFHCWKVLIEIFANNDEICSPKRIRLICIPLKSSHSKTTQAAAVKFKVWWYLITKINVYIEQYIDAILEPFLAFCYGSVNRNSSCVTDFKEMTILCLISLLGSTTKLVKKRMEYFEIDVLAGPLINKNIMNKSWNSMITYTTDAIKDCSDIKNSGSDLSELLLRNLLMHVISIENIDALNFLFDKLRLCEDKDVMNNMHKFLCDFNFAAGVNSIDSDYFLGKALSAMCKFIVYKDVQNSANDVEEIMKIIFHLNSDRFRHVLDVFLSETLTGPSRSFGNGISTWKLISKSLVNNFGKCHQSECDANLNIINQWIIWPLKAYSEDQNHHFKTFDDQFGVLLHMVVERLNSAIDKTTFLKDTSLLLQRMYSSKTVNVDLKAYFACFIRILVSSSQYVKRDEELLSVTFDILKTNLSGEFNKCIFELCMKCLKGLVTYLGESGIDRHFCDITDAWSQVINIKRNNSIDKVSFDDHRKQFLDEVKKVASKTDYHKIKNYLENDDLFVIIPSVWSLNPDKLTERQKEKFFEKSDIPALYNDMSQSQDAFIKPWTPKKLVIAKGHVEEIVIGDGRDTLGVHEKLNSSITNQNENTVKDEGFSKVTFPQNETEHPKQKSELTKLCKTSPFSETSIIRNNVSLKPQEEDTNYLRTKSKISTIEVEENPNNSNLDDYVEQVEAIILKDTSSPPDRKQTNNSTSPVLKPKTTHLTGRGAQLINMIRNKKHENYSTKQIDTSTPVTKLEQNREKMDSYLNWSNVESDSKPSPMNLLVFSKTLPSPCASPSASILKRKHPNDSMEDVYDFQAYKRKRVSFHDPPVSVTKEYLKDEENKNNSKRCLLLDQDVKGTTKHLLRRSAKIENQTQSEHFSEMTALNGTPIKKVNCSLMNCEDSGSKNSTPTISKASFPFLFRTEGDVLNYVIKQFSIEHICEKYLSDDKSDKAGNELSKFISHYMNVSSKFKSTILETLSEKHPKEFLDYAIQENLSSVVCDRLNSNAVIDYVCSKSQTNIATRTRLFQEMQDILNQEKFADEKCEFIQKTVTSKSMSDQQLLNLIEMLFESKRKHQRAVSESAIDSSSTL